MNGLFACLALWSLPKFDNQSRFLNCFWISGQQCSVAGSTACKLRCDKRFFMLRAK